MRYLDKSQLRRLLEVAREQNPKDHLLILVSYCHGLRSSEAVNLHKGSTSAKVKATRGGKPNLIHAGYVEDGYLIIQRLKNSLATRQPLVSSDDPLLDEKSLLAAQSNGPLFSGYSRYTFQNRMRKYCKIAEIPRALAHPHVLKRSMGKHMVHGAGVEMTREWLGHRSLASTGAYIRQTQEEAFAAMTAAVFKAA